MCIHLTPYAFKIDFRNPFTHPLKRPHAFPFFEKHHASINSIHKLEAQFNPLLDPHTPSPPCSSPKEIDFPNSPSSPPLDPVPNTPSPSSLHTVPQMECEVGLHTIETHLQPVLGVVTIRLEAMQLFSNGFKHNLRCVVRYSQFTAVSNTFVMDVHPKIDEKYRFTVTNMYAPIVFELRDMINAQKNALDMSEHDNAGKLCGSCTFTLFEVLEAVSWSRGVL